MPNSKKISRDKPSIKSMDYMLLREQGIKHLQNYSDDVWTDHNLHDPGITVLEALCYAITDLGNRINLPIADILASQPNLTAEKLETVFPTAPNILTSCAWTEKDLRKVLIDLPGVKNIYLQKAEESEQEFFFNESLNGLTYIPTSNPVNVNGLYRIKVELDQSENFNDLNSNVLITSITVDLGTGPVSFEVFVTVPYWDEANPVWLETGNLTNIILSQPINAVADPSISDFFGELTFEVNSASLIENFSFRAQIDPPIEDPTNLPLVNAVIAELETMALDLATTSLFSQFKLRLQEINTIIQGVKQRYHANRNLCEDIYSIEAVRVQEIAVFTRIELVSGADANKMLAQVYFVLDQFFCPTFPWYGMEDLLEKGLSISEILEGPLLTNGFILNKDLDSIIRQGIVYTSDLIRLIMALPEVFSVSGLGISNFIDNIKVSGAAPEVNCLELIDTDRFKPKFSIQKSDIKFIRNDIEIEIDKALVTTALEDLKNQASALPGTLNLGLEIPEGEKLELQQYHSIQYEFPATYGVGRHAIAPSMSNLRLAQSKQFKGYLTFFDQLLANYSAQIANICGFYSPEETVKQTYYNTPLYEVPGAEELLVQFLGSGIAFKDFMADDTNGYRNALDTYFESEAIFLERRSRLLDHLLARFGERFPDSSSLEYSGTNIHHILDKIRYFKNYPVISGFLGKSYDVGPVPGGGDVWDTTNISGLQQRIAGLLGIDEPQRRNFSGNPDTTEYFDFFATGPNFGFRLLGDNSQILFESLLFPSQIAAQNIADQVIKFGVITSNYGIAGIQNISGEDFLVVPLLNQTNTTIGNARILLDLNLTEDLLRIQAIRKVRNALVQAHKDGEGFYLLEHVLLRPVRNDISNTDNFLPTINNNENRFQIKDPYSFRISFFFPSGMERDFNDSNATPRERTWSFRFRSLAFKEFLSKIIREETPAHILPQIYFLDTNTSVDAPTTPSLNNFEKVFQNWLIDKTDSNTSETDLTTSQNALIVVLENIINP